MQKPETFFNFDNCTPHEVGESPAEKKHPHCFKVPAKIKNVDLIASAESRDSMLEWVEVVKHQIGVFARASQLLSGNPTVESVQQDLPRTCLLASVLLYSSY